MQIGLKRGRDEINDEEINKIEELEQPIVKRQNKDDQPIDGSEVPTFNPETDKPIDAAQVARVVNQSNVIAAMA